MIHRLQLFTSIVLSVLMLSCAQQTKTDQQPITSVSKEIKEIHKGILEGYLSEEFIQILIYGALAFFVFGGFLEVLGIKPSRKNNSSGSGFIGAILGGIISVVGSLITGFFHFNQMHINAK